MVHTDRGARNHRVFGSVGIASLCESIACLVLCNAPVLAKTPVPAIVDEYMVTLLFVVPLVVRHDR